MAYNMQYAIRWVLLWEDVVVRGGLVLPTVCGIVGRRRVACADNNSNFATPFTIN